MKIKLKKKNVTSYRLNKFKCKSCNSQYSYKFYINFEEEKEYELIDLEKPKGAEICSTSRNRNTPRRGGVRRWCGLTNTSPRSARPSIPPFVSNERMRV